MTNKFTPPVATPTSPVKPPLSWWRTLPPKEITRRVDDLAAHLSAVTAGRVDDTTLAAALHGDDMAAVTIADALLGTETKDVLASWMALAAARGYAFAKFALCQMLLGRMAQIMQKGDSPNSKRERVALLRLALAWNGNGLRFPSMVDTAGRRRLCRYLMEQIDFDDRHHGVRSDPGTPADDLLPDKPPEKPARPAALPRRQQITVLKGIGDSGTREGRDLARQYERLTQPLDLVPCPLRPDLLAWFLRDEAPWMGKAIDIIETELRLNGGAGHTAFKLPPLLLVGPPGVGKTTFAKRLVTLAKVGYAEINAAGSTDNRLLAGTARGWSSTQPCLPLIVMAHSGCANPLIVVDEIDKSGGSDRNGVIAHTLLSMLEPATARAWPDEALMVPADLSHVSWVLTANHTAGIPAPLLSRLTVVHVGGPRPEHFSRVLLSLIRDLADELEVVPQDLPPLDAEAHALLRKSFTAGVSPRRIKLALRRILGASGRFRRLLH